MYTGCVTSASQQHTQSQRERPGWRLPHSPADSLPRHDIHAVPASLTQPVQLTEDNLCALTQNEALCVWERPPSSKGRARLSAG